MDWLHTLLDWIYPRRCAFCGKLMDAGEEGDFCPLCLEQLSWLEEPLCMKDLGELEHVYCALYYKNPVPEGIYRFKFQNKSRLHKPFVELMLSRMREQLLEERCELVTSVPMHPRRKRRRGYDQAELMAREVARQLALPYEPVLKRVKLTKTQHRVGLKERRSAQKGSFACKALSGEKVLLIDDIFTSGATMMECARVLREGGASSICGAALCRAGVRKDGPPGWEYQKNDQE